MYIGGIKQRQTTIHQIHEKKSHTQAEYGMERQKRQMKGDRAYPEKHTQMLNKKNHTFVHSTNHHQIKTKKPLTSLK